MAPISRNAPCPCGSGKRYKQCCGALAAASPDAASHPMYPGWEQLGRDECASLWDTMQAALQAQKSGRQDHAKALYEGVLERAPDTFDALHMLGVIEMEFGNLDLAEDLMVRAMKWWVTPDVRNNLNLLRTVRRDREGIYSLRSVAAADAVALFASRSRLPDSRDGSGSRLMHPETMAGITLHVVVPGDILNPGSNRTGTRLCERYRKAGASVSLWRDARQGVPKAALHGARDIDAVAGHVPDGGVLVIAGLELTTSEWLPACAAGFDEIDLLMDVHAPQPLATLIGRLPVEVLQRVRMVARSANVLQHWGLGGIVDPLLFGGAPASCRHSERSARPRLGVFIAPLGGNRDRERWEMLNWLRAQGAFIRILYPGRLPSPHIADEEEHLCSLVTDWDDEWASDLDALFYWGAEGRAHQFDSLAIEAETAGLPLVRDGYAETAVPEAGSFFFTAQEARHATEKLIRELRD